MAPFAKKVPDPWKAFTLPPSDLQNVILKNIPYVIYVKIVIAATQLRVFARWCYCHSQNFCVWCDPAFPVMVFHYD